LPGYEQAVKKQTSRRACRAPAGCVPFAWATGGARHAKRTEGSSSTYQTGSMDWRNCACSKGTSMIGTWINVLGCDVVMKR